MHKKLHYIEAKYLNKQYKHNDTANNGVQTFPSYILANALKRCCSGYKLSNTLKDAVARGIPSGEYQVIASAIIMSTTI